MILAEIQYKTHDNKPLAIFKIFKTWCNYLKDYKHKILVFINHNNFYYFMDTKSLSF